MIHGGYLLGGYLIQILINIQFGMVTIGKIIVSMSMDMTVIFMYKIQKLMNGKFFMTKNGLITLTLNISIIILGIVLMLSIIMLTISIGFGVNLPKIGLMNINI